jgi:ketosteroid isomerase-like protein
VSDRPVRAAGADDVRALHLGWLWGWDKEPGAGHWDFQEIQGSYYNWDLDTLRLYDDMDPEHRVVRTAREYQAIWEPTFNSLRSAVHRLEDGPEITRSGDLAVSRLVFIARLVVADGSIVDIRTHNTLIWRHLGGSWKIVGDHTSSQRIAADEADRLLASLPGAHDDA